MHRRRPILALFGGMATTLLLAGCQRGAPAPGSNAAAPPEPLRIAAASDLQTVLPALARRFNESTGHEVTLTFGASGMLAEQIRGGAPFDLFLAANQQFVKDLAAVGLVRPDSVRPYARGTLVLAIHRESGQPVEGLADLAHAAVKKIALANPETAPYGLAGKQALERSGLWSKLESKIVRSESVSQALKFVATGNAEAGLVGHAIASVPSVRVVAIDSSLYDPIIQTLGIVSESKQPEVAGTFAEFVVSETGQSILTAAGFASAQP